LVAAVLGPSPASSEAPAAQGLDESAADAHILLNWSATHSVQTNSLFVPENVQQVERLVAERQQSARKLRPLGSALSPNGAAFEADGMISLALLDRILWIDPKRAQIRVQAGARIAQITEALRQKGLVLQNFASISEQQVGGFIQVGAHGTGARIPPVDEQVVSFRMVTPALGSMEVGRSSPLFPLLRVGLGAFGVVTEVTLQAVPAHKLVEYTKVLSHDMLRERHQELIESHQHLRYMWIPYTDTVVVVYSDPLEQATTPAALTLNQNDREFRLAPMRELLASKNSKRINEEELHGMNFAELRDQLIALDPLNTSWIQQVNRAEAEFWKRSEGIRIDWSDRILGFDCGGQQWVSETAFHAPIGQFRDIDYMMKLLRLIQKHQIPAPAPIEQRWTSGSSSIMSPVYRKPGSLSAAEDVFSWVGIIMYLPTTDEHTRTSISKEFWHYKSLCSDLWQEYDAAEHWAKIEVPSPLYMEPQLAAKYKDFVLQRVRSKFPLEEFRRSHELLDPKRIMTNRFIDELVLDNLAERTET
jgi:L-galactono-1,4-lactone dehydrogenase